MVYRMGLTYDEVIDKLDLKIILTKRTRYSLTPGTYEITEINKTLNYIFPDNVKLSITFDDIGIKSILNIIQNLLFTTNFFSIDY